jgi:simple sugar transport system permease protein
MSEQIRTALGRVTDAVDTMKEVVYQIVAIIFAFIAGALVLYITGYSPVDAYSAMALGAFGDIFGVGQTLMQATPIIFTSLA